MTGILLELKYKFFIKVFKRVSCSIIPWALLSKV